MKIFATYEVMPGKPGTQAGHKTPGPTLSIRIVEEYGDEMDAKEVINNIKKSIKSTLNIDSYDLGGGVWYTCWKLPDVGGETLSGKLRLVAGERIVTYDALMDAVFDAGLAQKAVLKK